MWMVDPALTFWNKVLQIMVSQTPEFIPRFGRTPSQSIHLTVQTIQLSVQAYYSPLNIYYCQSCQFWAVMPTQKYSAYYRNSCNKKSKMQVLQGDQTLLQKHRKEVVVQDTVMAMLTMEQIWQANQVGKLANGVTSTDLESKQWIGHYASVAVLYPLEGQYQAEWYCTQQMIK